MDRTTTAFRTLHDIGAAAWFGGALMGVVGLNAAADTAGSADRDRVAAAGWSRWSPVARAAMGAHVAGSIGMLRHDRGPVAAAGLGLGAAAVGATAGTAVLGSRPGTEATVRKLEWAVPALLAGVVLLGTRRR